MVSLALHLSPFKPWIAVLKKQICELMKDIQKCGQFTIWNEDADNNEINESELLHKVTEYIQSYSIPII